MILGVLSRSASILVGSIVLVCVTPIACNMKQAKFDSGLPFTRTEMTVESSAELGGYLQANLQFNDRQLSTFTLPTQECRDVFATGKSVQYVDSGPLGVFRREDFECQTMGKGNLAVWRDRSQRAAREPLPRAQANYRVLDRTDEVTFLHGSFPFAGRVGFSNSADVVAQVPNTGECKEIIERTTASLEYRQRGPQAFVLVGKSGVCEISGFALPLPENEAAR